MYSYTSQKDKRLYVLYTGIVYYLAAMINKNQVAQLSAARRQYSRKFPRKKKLSLSLGQSCRSHYFSVKCTGCHSLSSPSDVLYILLLRSRGATHIVSKFADAVPFSIRRGSRFYHGLLTRAPSIYSETWTRSGIFQSLFLLLFARDALALSFFLLIS